MAQPTPSSANCHRLAANAQGPTGNYPTYREVRDFSAKSSIVTFGARIPTVRHVGKRAGGVLVASIAALTGCSGSGPTAAPSETTSRSAVTTPTTVRPRVTTTTTVPEFSFDDSVPPPKLVNTGTNYVAILKSLQAYDNWGAAHRPDPALTARTVARGTKLYDLYVQDTTRLRDNDMRGVETLAGPSTYKIISATKDAFSAQVSENISVHKTVRRGGTVSSEIHFATPTIYQILVVLTQGHWLLADVEEHAAGEQG